MAKLFLFMMVSTDGYFEGPGHDLSWHNVDDEFNEFAIKQTGNVGTLLFGRKTYELMRDYWPSGQAMATDPIVAEQMNTTPKIVFSKTLENVSEAGPWKNIKLMKEINPEVIINLKKTSVKDLGLYGSNNLCVELMKLNLVDEFRIMINPVAVGQGTNLFYGLEKKFKFILVDTRIFKSGNALLIYRPENI